MKILIIGIALAIGLAIAASCRKRTSDQGGDTRIASDDSPAREIIVGGLYASQNEDGSFGVLKVLVLDEYAVHLRSYKNRFDELPQDLDSSILSLGGINDPDGFGIGHFPMAKEGFWNSNPIFLKQEPVEDEELEGYRVYLEATGQ